MDADEQLARQLQEEEYRQAALAVPRPQQGAPPEQALIARIMSGVQTAMRYEDETLQAIALSVIPEERLREQARSALAGERGAQEQGGGSAGSAPAGKPAALGEQDAFVRQLLSWFKRDFFTWVDRPACERCGCKDTTAAGMGQPTPQEAASGTGRIELYTCPACGATTRFPRINDPAQLLVTRRGRCGEWANAFVACARACDLDARWVLDFTDHVWAEYWSESQARWVHLDPCEDAFDQPLLYEAGWGKKLNYVLAFSKGGVRDVTRRYTANFAALAPRRTLISEQALVDTCRGVTQRMRAQLGAPERQRLESRDAAEDAQLSGQKSQPPPQDAALPGRQTGSLAWRAARGELGSDAPPALAAAAQPEQALVAKDSTGIAPLAPAAAAQSCSSISAKNIRPDSLPDMTALQLQPDAAIAEPIAPATADCNGSLGRRLKESCAVSTGAAGDRSSGVAQNSVEGAKARLAERVRTKFASLMAAGGLAPNEAAAAALKWASAQH